MVALGLVRAETGVGRCNSKATRSTGACIKKTETALCNLMQHCSQVACCLLLPGALQPGTASNSLISHLNMFIQGHLHGEVPA